MKRPALGRWVSATLRIGTVVAMVAVAIGLGWALLAGGPPPGPRPVIDLVAAGGGDALIAAGLLGLALLPIGVGIAAAVVFARAREQGPLLATVVVLVLLLASLGVAAVVASGAG